MRPEKIGISLASAPAARQVCALRGTVNEVVYLGTSTNYNVHDRRPVPRSSSSCRTPRHADDIADRGDNVWLSWEPQHSYAIGDR